MNGLPPDTWLVLLGILVVPVLGYGLYRLDIARRSSPDDAAPDA